MKAVFIVEGESDKRQLELAFDYHEDLIVLVTEGTKVSNYLINEITRYLNEGIGVYILTDWDEGGHHLAEMINNFFPELERINVNDKKCGYFTGEKYKYGIEHAPYKYLLKTLCPYMGMEYEEDERNICWD